MDLEPKVSFSIGRRFLFSLNVAFATGAVLAIVLMLNYLSARHFRRIPISTKAQASLSPMTLKVLSTLTNQVRVVVYFDKKEPIFPLIWALLKEYEFANSKISVEAIDPDHEPAAAEAARVAYKLGNRNVIVFDCKGRPPAYVNQDRLSDVDVQGLISGRTNEVRRSSFKGEAEFTTAIMRVTTLRPLKAYFLEGHGEHNPASDERQSGYSKFVEVLNENNIDFGILRNLYTTADIPADCNLLIIAGPTDAFLREELENIDRYLKQGGRAFVLLNHKTVGKETGLERILAGWGVRVGMDRIQDKENARTRDELIVTHFGVHKSIKPLYQSTRVRGLLMLLPRSVRPLQMGTTTADAPKVDVLTATGPRGRAIQEFRNGLPHEGPDDFEGTVPLMVAVEKGRMSGVADRAATRMVVVGDSLFLANQIIDELANRDFASHMVSWLVDRDELLSGLPPRPIKDYKLDMTQSQQATASWILIGGMPGAVLLLGSLVWFRRRH